MKDSITVVATTTLTCRSVFIVFTGIDQSSIVPGKLRHCAFSLGRRARCCVLVFLRTGASPKLQQLAFAR